MAETGIGKTAVITGASGGIGTAVAKALSNAGWNLVLNARSEQKILPLAAQLKSPAIIAPGDLREANVPATLLAAALSTFGRCDLCFNNAGVIEVGPIETIDIDRTCDMVRLNVEGAFRVTYTFLKHFIGQKTGHLINTSSVLGTKVRPTAGAYAGTKFAIEALSEALRMELSKTDVQVSCIEPGLVMTGLHDRWQEHPSKTMSIAEPLLPDDIARLVMFMLEQPAHVRIPRLMVLPKGHEI
jgi:NADP-dependent 3-hydroxy acid dehydrogenase YdfG